MSDTTAGFLQVALLIALLAAAHVPLGNYMARVYSSVKHSRVERGLYRVMGVDPDADQRWTVYLRSLLAFSLVGLLFLYAFQRVQQHLLLSLGFPAVKADQAWNTAASFLTNTNWQSYSGESTMGYLVQMAGLAVQNFVSAAVGIAVAIALIRGFTRSRTDRIGNFWVDLTRGCLRILLPLAFVFAIVLIVGGAVQNLHSSYDTVTTLANGQQTITGGPVASQEAIKELGTNGGGFYNANSAHPFENPTKWTNLLEIFLLLVIPFSLPRTFGKLVGDVRQGYAILAAMATIWVVSVVGLTAFEAAHQGTALQAAGAAMEGKETRLGIPASALFASSTTLTSTGAVNSFHDSFTPLGGGITIFDMMTGEVAPGGVGSGLYGILVLAVVAVFVAGLMVGRTPEYLGKKIQSREIKLASLYILATPACVLIGTGIAMALPGERASMLNPGAHGLSEVLYAFTSASNNNGSAFAGISVNTVWYNTALGLAMLIARFLPIVFVLGLAGSLARQQPVPVTAGTLPTHRPLFVGLLLGVVVIVVSLTYFPALALGPLAEGLH
jgi:potassium-transporting ATPase potassium-binding subunit